jgi:hypothetical protein
MQNNTTAAIKTDWDFTLFYTSDTDPLIEKDMQAIEKACSSFAKKYNAHTTQDKKIRGLRTATEKATTKPQKFLQNELRSFGIAKILESGKQRRSVQDSPRKEDSHCFSICSASA